MRRFLAPVLAPTLFSRGAASASAPASAPASAAATPSPSALAAFVASASRLLVITGAGVSTESGLPDYRGPGGAYSRLNQIGTRFPLPPARFNAADGTAASGRHLYAYDPDGRMIEILQLDSRK